jgi:hypothetical protein
VTRPPPQLISPSRLFNAKAEVSEDCDIVL